MNKFLGLSYLLGIKNYFTNFNCLIWIKLFKFCRVVVFETLNTLLGPSYLQGMKQRLVPTATYFSIIIRFVVSAVSILW